MQYLYTIAISLYNFFIFIASFFNAKAKKWVDGRKFFLKNLTIRFGNGGCLWFHCASLGEFEQARSLIEKFKSQNGEHKIVITFFSPSGYEIRKNYSLADGVYYLPMDSKKNAKKFIDAVQPTAAFFVKYEFWFHYLNELKKRKVPTYLISASFRDEQHFFKWYGGWFRNILKMFTRIFVQNEVSQNLLHKHEIKNVTLSGDTRFDRVHATMQDAEELPLIEKFKNGEKLLIAGSTWEGDEKILLEVFSRLPPSASRLKFIIAPHEVNEKNIQRVVSLFPGCIRYSELSGIRHPIFNILIIDNIGMLSRIYRYGDIAYIGGAFGKSLHNILEPAAFGLPVLFGPNHHKFWEAAALIEKGGAFSVNNSKELNDKINFLLHDEIILRIASEMSRNFVWYNTGATKKIMTEIFPVSENY